MKVPKTYHPFFSKRLLFSNCSSGSTEFSFDNHVGNYSAKLGKFFFKKTKNCKHNKKIRVDQNNSYDTLNAILTTLPSFLSSYHFFDFKLRIFLLFSIVSLAIEIWNRAFFVQSDKSFQIIDQLFPHVGLKSSSILQKFNEWIFSYHELNFVVVWLFPDVFSAKETWKSF